MRRSLDMASTGRSWATRTRCVPAARRGEPLFGLERNKRIDAQRAARRDVTGDEGDCQQQGGDGYERERIGGLDAEQETGDHACGEERAGDPDGDTGECEEHAVA